jgi:hypothetical protein
MNLKIVGEKNQQHIALRTSFGEHASLDKHSKCQQSKRKLNAVFGEF